jgi:hypothetical protein
MLTFFMDGGPLSGETAHIAVFGFLRTILALALLRSLHHFLCKAIEKRKRITAHIPGPRPWLLFGNLFSHFGGLLSAKVRFVELV